MGDGCAGDDFYDIFIILAVSTMDRQNEQTEENGTQNPMKQINRALGLFICFFAVIVLVSMFFTETFIGKMTNLGAGSILTVVGIIMIFQPKIGSSDS